VSHSETAHNPGLTKDLTSLPVVMNGFIKGNLFLVFCRELKLEHVIDRCSTVLEGLNPNSKAPHKYAQGEP